MHRIGKVNKENKGNFAATLINLTKTLTMKKFTFFSTKVRLYFFPCKSFVCFFSIKMNF